MNNTQRTYDIALEELGSDRERSAKGKNEMTKTKLQFNVIRRKAGSATDQILAELETRAEAETYVIDMLKPQQQPYILTRQEEIDALDSDMEEFARIFGQRAADDSTFAFHVADPNGTVSAWYDSEADASEALFDAAVAAHGMDAWYVRIKESEVGA